MLENREGKKNFIYIYIYIYIRIYENTERRKK